MELLSISIKRLTGMEKGFVIANQTILYPIKYFLKQISFNNLILFLVDHIFP